MPPEPAFKPILTAGEVVAKLLHALKIARPVLADAVPLQRGLDPEAELALEVADEAIAIGEAAK